jgi:hypothetical protein
MRGSTDAGHAACILNTCRSEGGQGGSCLRDEVQGFGSLGTGGLEKHDKFKEQALETVVIMHAGVSCSSHWPPC